MSQTIQVKRGLDANINALTLLPGEPAWTTDTKKLYIGFTGGKVLINPTQGTAATANTGIAEGEIPVLGAGGKLPDSVIPKIAITNTFVVDTQEAMLALTAEVGDVAVRSDVSESYILKAEPATEVANWVKLLTPVKVAVDSVNGLTGDVKLNGSNIHMDDYSSGALHLPITAADSINMAIGKLEFANMGKAALNSPMFTGIPTAPTPDKGTSNTQIATTAFVQTAIETIDGGTF